VPASGRSGVQVAIDPSVFVMYEIVSCSGDALDSVEVPLVEKSAVLIVDDDGLINEVIGAVQIKAGRCMHRVGHVSIRIRAGVMRPCCSSH
jgi:hypothetical protein